MSAFPLSSFIVRSAVAAAHPVRSQLLVALSLGRLYERLQAIEARLQRWLVAHSIAVLRVNLGTVFLTFGVLKFFPGVSPAQNLVEKTTDILTLGLVPGSVSLVLVATLECTIGLCLISGRAVRAAVYLLGIQLVGILSPLVLLPGRLFDGPHGAPTLEGQYVLKDLILVGAALVIAAALGGVDSPASRTRRASGERNTPHHRTGRGAAHAVSGRRRPARRRATARQCLVGTIPALKGGGRGAALDSADDHERQRARVLASVVLSPRQDRPTQRRWT